MGPEAPSVFRAVTCRLAWSFAAMRSDTRRSFCRRMALGRAAAIAVVLSSRIATAAAAPGVPGNGGPEELTSEVMAAERAFAATMASRDLQAFAQFVSEDAVFRSGEALHVGRTAVVQAWQDDFAPGPAPFSWSPDRVTVANGGASALSSGPVRAPDGKVIGRYTSIWRKERDADGTGHWRVVVDQGVPLLECAAIMGK